MYIYHINIAPTPEFNTRLFQTLYMLIKKTELCSAAFNFNMKPMPFFGKSRDEQTMMRLATLLGGR